MTESKQVIEGLDTPDHEKWQKHRSLTHLAGYGTSAFRGYLGIALVVDSTTEESWQRLGSHVFLPNRTVRWAFLADVPKPETAAGKRDGQIASLRTADCSYGMPMLRRGSEGYEMWDFRVPPHDRLKFSEGNKTWTAIAGVHVLPPDRVQEFRTFNAVNMAMTTAAFAFNRRWQPAQGKMRKVLELAPGAPALAFGEAMQDAMASPEAWMPRAYLCFPEALADTLFERSIELRHGGPVWLPDGLVWEFWKALVADPDDLPLAYRANEAGKILTVTREDYRGLNCTTLQIETENGRTMVRFHRTAEIHKKARSTFEPGEVLAHEQLHTPPEWNLERPLRAIREKLLPQFFKRSFLLNVRVWFERQFVCGYQGHVHVDSRLAERAALGHAVAEGLLWDVTPGEAYWNNSAEAFIFPPLRIPRWDALAGSLPGEIRFDVRPPEPFFVGMRSNRKPDRKKAKAAKAAKAAKPKERQPEKPQDKPQDKRPKLVPAAKAAIVSMPQDARQPKRHKKPKSKSKVRFAEAMRPAATIPEPQLEAVAMQMNGKEVAEKQRQRTGTPTYPDLTDEDLDAMFRPAD